MKVIKEKIGEATILIQAIDDSVELIETIEGRRATQTTAITVDIKDAYAQVKSMITQFANDLGKDFKGLDAKNRPQQIEIEYNIGISVTAGPVWLLSGSGEHGLKVKMTWTLAPKETLVISK